MPTRPRDSSATRLAILDAARRQFRARGFEATTTRLVAGQVGVDAALISRYFGSKQELWEAAIHVELDLPSFAGVAPAHVGEAVVRAFLARWEGEQAAALHLVLASATDPDVAARLRAVFVEQVRPAVRTAAADRARDRTELVVTTLLGLAACRYLYRLPGIADRSSRGVVRLYGPLVQRHLTEPLD